MAGTIVRPTVAPTPEVRRPSPAAPAPWRPSLRGIVARVAVLLAVVGAVLLLPMLVPATDVNVVSRVTVFAIVALSLNVLVGYTGQVSLGHAAFLGFGAFGSGYALTEMGLTWPAAAVVAVLIGGGVAALLGGVALRIQGLYLALVTLAFGLFAEQVMFNIPAVTGGGAGMPAPRPAFATGDRAYAYLCLAALVAVWLLDRRVTTSKVGRAIRALRDSERVAASWGINVTRYKLLAFVLSGSIAGLAGALFASIEQIVSNLTFSFTLSLTFLFMAVIGGVGSRVGVVIGAALIGAMPFVLDRAAETNPGFPVDGSAAVVLTALLLLLVLVRFPGGIAQLLGGVVRWCSFRPWKAAGRDSAPTPTGGDSGRP
ncbi:MAG: branched-chain amino acid ABC transporter permease [Nitriliruptor sp.]